MKIQLSMLEDSRVKANKGGNLGEIDAIITLDSFAELTDACLLYHIAVGVFKDGIRNGDHFEKSSILAFDFDNGTTALEIHNQCKARQWSHIIMASKNHLKDKGDGAGVVERFHLFIPYESYSKADYKYAAKRISNLMNWTCDKACTDATRYFYKHSATLYCWTSGNGIRKDFIERLRATESLAIEEQKNSKHTSASTPATLDDIEKSNYFNRCKDGLNSVGDRYYTMRKLVNSIKYRGLSKSDAILFINRHAPHINGRDWSRLVDKWWDWLAAN